MKYMGSKRRIAKHIIPIMVKYADDANIKDWIEPFVGGGNLIDKVPENFVRKGYDLNPHVIKAMIDIRDNPLGFPEKVTEDEYKAYKGRGAESITSWVRFVCSFGGKFEAGYARSKNRNYCRESKDNAIKQSPLIKGVDFECLSYEELHPKLSLIYCDPPYKNSTGYATENFDHDKFFDWCREISKENIVFVSEYSAPNDFIDVWRGEQKTNFDSRRNSATHNAIERLFLVKGDK